MPGERRQAAERGAERQSFVQDCSRSGTALPLQQLPLLFPLTGDRWLPVRPGEKTLVIIENRLRLGPQVV
jgi:hypothetical protein